MLLSISCWKVFHNECNVCDLFFLFYHPLAEIGDFNPEEHKNGYLSELRLIPNQTEEIEKKIMELHKLHK